MSLSNIKSKLYPAIIDLEIDLGYLDLKRYNTGGSFYNKKEDCKISKIWSMKYIVGGYLALEDKLNIKLAQ